MAQTTIQGGFLAADLVSAQTALTTGLATTDEIIVSDAGVIKRMDISVLRITADQITASGTLPALNGVALTALNGTQVTSGTLPAARIAADSIVEGKLNVSNGPTNGQVLTARDGVAGGYTWEAASAGATLSGSTDNTIVTVTGANAMTGESVLTYTGGILQLDYDSGSAEFKLDGSNGKAAIQLKNAGTAKWDMGMDGDGSSQQKSHVDDFGIYNHAEAKYVVVVAGTGSNRGGLGVHAGIATDGNEIPIHGITQGKGNRAHTQYGAIACLVTKSGNQTLPDTTETPITWNVESHDTDDGTASGGTGTMHDTSTNSERIYARTAGWYLVGATCALNTGYARMVLKHDSTWISNQRHGVADVRFSSSAVDYFTVGTYFKVEMSQWSGSKTIYASNARAWMIRIA